ncbi:MAG TPA: glycosyltransferase family 4 protein [Candidatus Thermoplasmatota archaeon]|nr:glycosyltransferase family 4 protein [Candidatus Thermoplasmatota archaeon]
MRIALVSPFDPHDGPDGAHVGGVERVYAELSQRLANRGHDVTLISTTSAPPSGRADGVRRVHERRRLTIMRTPVARLARHVPRDADVVQVPATYPFTTPPVLRRARQLGIPSVLDFHFEPVPGGVVGRWAAKWYGMIGPRSYPLADAVIVRSHAYARHAPSLARTSPARWRIVPNGIDTDRFRPDGPARTGDYLLFVGRLVPYKGVDVLLRALQRVRAAPPLLIAGDGPLRRRWETLGNRLRVDVTWLGHVRDEDLPGLYRGAKLTILPSVSRQEAFGITLLESMACGTPVVASALPGVGELAHVGGRVAAPGDPKALADAIANALHGDLPRGPSLSSRVRETYSWEAITDRVASIYDEIRRGTGNGGGDA